MALVILFIVLLILIFGVVVFVLRPTRTEKAVDERLTDIRGILDASKETSLDLLKQEKLSDVPWLNELLIQIPGAVRLQRFLSQAGSRRTVGELVFFSVFVAAVGVWFGILWAPTILLGIIVGLAAGASPYVYVAWKRSVRFARFEALLPETIDLMSRALRAGHGIVSAIEMVSQEISEPIASEFRRVFEQQNFGLPLREAMLNLSERVPLPDVHFLVTAILVQKETGGNLAEVLDKTAAVIRERFRLRGQLRIYTAQGRVTAWILGLLPFGLFAALNILNPSYGRIMLTDPVGPPLLYLGLVLMALGIWALRKIVDIEV
jgi:tight adherence protein B